MTAKGAKVVAAAGILSLAGGLAALIGFNGSKPKPKPSPIDCPVALIDCNGEAYCPTSPCVVP